MHSTRVLLMKIYKLGFLLAVTCQLFTCRARHKSIQAKLSTVVVPELSTVVVPEKELWHSTSIPVCWEGVGSETTAFRNAISNFIKSNVHQTKLTLTGWNLCEKDARGIRIFIYDDPENDRQMSLKELKTALQNSSNREFQGHPRSQGKGIRLDGKKGGLILTSQFKEVEPYLEKVADSLDEQGRLNLLLSISLHEMGHALGLLHEDVHPESTCEVEETIGDGVPVSNYNDLSIMSRCYYRDYHYQNGTLGMNDEDILGINKAYDFLAKP